MAIYHKSFEKRKVKKKKKRLITAPLLTDQELNTKFVRPNICAHYVRCGLMHKSANMSQLTDGP